ncbi:MAG TPA: hypothetical protein VGB85_00910, partial [Nannocystis sp.]
KFLATVALGAGATTLPVWLSRAFRRERDCEVDLADHLADSPVQMSDPEQCLPGGEHGPQKPRLVFVIPTDDRLQWLRGQAFGELLNHGSDAQLAPLACFEVLCRPTGDPLDEPLMLLLDPATGTTISLDAPLPVDPDDPYPPPTRDEEARIDDRIAVLARLISDAADGSRLAAQACRERASLPPGDLRRLDELPASIGELQPSEVDRAPATTMLAARSAEPEVREHLTALLAAGVRARLCDRPIDGAPWARATGCGVRVEGDDRPSGIMCGMGHTPERSRRFLKFYVDQD